MGRRVYIGRPSEHIGKTAFQILANLKNFGVGRMLTRHEFDKFPEPSYHIVKRVETYMDPELKFGTLWCETVERGERLPGIRPMKYTYRPDFRLIPKDEENDFIGSFKILNIGENMKILPRFYSTPPLMREWLIRRSVLAGKIDENQAKTMKNFQIPFIYQNEKDLRKIDADLFQLANRIANENETPTVEFDGKFHFNEEYLGNCKP